MQIMKCIVCLMFVTWSVFCMIASYMWISVVCSHRKDNKVVAYHLVPSWHQDISNQHNDRGLSQHASRVSPRNVTDGKLVILTRWGWVMHICISKLCHYWFRHWLVACLAPSNFLNWCWLAVNWTLGNKLQWNLNQNSKIFIHENAFACIICKMSAILSQSQWVNDLL